MQPVEKLVLTKNWIVWNKYWKAFSPRQVLITQENVYKKYNLQYWDLKENIIVDQTLDSWDILNIWKAKIRLTYFCEWCKKLWLEKSILKNIWKDRWILGIILTGWEIKVWDKIVLEKKKLRN